MNARQRRRVRRLWARFAMTRLTGAAVYARLSWLMWERPRTPGALEHARSLLLGGAHAALRDGDHRRVLELVRRVHNAGRPGVYDDQDRKATWVYIAHMLAIEANYEAYRRGEWSADWVRAVGPEARRLAAEVGT